MYMGIPTPLACRKPGGPQKCRPPTLHIAIIQGEGGGANKYNMYLPPACYICLAPPLPYEETIRNLYVRGGTPPNKHMLQGPKKM